MTFPNSQRELLLAEPEEELKFPRTEERSQKTDQSLCGLEQATSVAQASILSPLKWDIGLNHKTLPLKYLQFLAFPQILLVTPCIAEIEIDFSPVFSLFGYKIPRAY